MFVFLSSIKTFSQAPSNFQIFIAGPVGCQTLTLDSNNPKRIYSLEEIPDTVCLKACENSQMSFQIFTTSQITSQNSFAVTWGFTGGIGQAQGFNESIINWGAAGTGSVTFTITSQGSTFTKTICFDIIKSPTASFEIMPNSDSFNDLRACTNQEIYFTNTSNSNAGTSIMYYSWDFGDGTYSVATNPTHTYLENGTYTIKLTAINECQCSTTYIKTIKVGLDGITIDCPTVVCDKTSQTYNIVDLPDLQCSASKYWSIIGGSITSAFDQSVNVTWNNVDDSGFGYLTVDPLQCNVGCYEKTTVKIPVIQAVGTIKGKTSSCVGVQEKYSLPQWPSTTFKWEIQNNQNYNLANVLFIDQANEIIIKPLVGGTLKLNCTYYNTLLKCGGTATFTINVVFPETITGPENICSGTFGSYTTASNAPKNWTLKATTGQTISTLQSSANFNYNFISAGTYLLSFESTGTCATFIKTITVNQTVSAPPQANISSTTVKTCPDVPYNFTISGGNPNGQYLWTVSSGGTFIGNNTGNSVSIKFGNTAIHTITVVNQSLTTPTCLSTPTSFVLNSQQISAQITDNLPQTLCANTSANYRVNQLGTNNIFSEGETYTWSISPSNLGSVSSGQDTNSIAVLWNNVNIRTNATLTVQIKKCNITTTFTKTVTILPLAQIAISSVNSVCSGRNITFSLSVTNGVILAPGTIINWNYGNGTTVQQSGLTTTTNFSNTSPSNITQTVTASITNPNGCTGFSNIASKSISVVSAPQAGVAVFSGATKFCNSSTINTVLRATVTGGTWQWFKAGSPTVLGTTQNLTLNGTASFGFGNYYVLATNASGCTSISNEIPIYLNCPGIPNPETGTVCTLSPVPVITNNSALACNAPTTLTNCNCSQINLMGSASGNPISQRWEVQYPNGTYVSPQGATVGSTANPLAIGTYRVNKEATYLCNGQQQTFSNTAFVVLPYISDFTHALSCGTNPNTRKITFTNKSPFVANIPNASRTFRYFRGTTTSGPWTLVASTQNAVLDNMPAGNYVYKLVITGSLNGVAQTPCEKIVSFPIAGTPNQSIKIVNSPFCHDTPMQFSLNNGQLLTETYLWTFDNGAQNTIAEPTRVFDSSGLKTVSVVVTDQYGCSRTLTTTLTIPPRCFNGDITPLSATACLGKNIQLKYLPSGTECATTQYEWLRDGTQVAATQTPLFNALESGTYRVRVRTAQNCTYTSPSTAIPSFVPPPALALKAPTQACQFTDVTFEAVTGATSITWTLNGSALPQFNDMQTANIAFATSGNNTVAVTVTTAQGCSTTESKSLFIIASAPTPVVRYQLQSCTPYLIKLTASGTPPFNWSNGMVGPEIFVKEGGVYKVTSSVGNCSNSATINVPKNPENYIWTFPAGCVQNCERDSSSLVGPIYPIASWEWLSTNSGSVSGTGVIQPFNLAATSNHSMVLNNGLCTVESKQLSFSKINCEKCGVQYSNINVVSSDNGFCESILTMDLYNLLPTATPVTFSTLNSNAFINPSSMILQPGLNSISLSVIPINGFLGGTMDFVATGLANGQKCFDAVKINVPPCGSINPQVARQMSDFKLQKFTISPNPANGIVTINFENELATQTVEVYDLLGKKIVEKQFDAKNGNWEFDTTALQKGIYIVVQKSTNGILSQQKLILN